MINTKRDLAIVNLYMIFSEYLSFFKSYDWNYIITLNNLIFRAFNRFLRVKKGHSFIAISKYFVHNRC